MNTYCDDCKRCTGGNMRKTDVPGGDDHNRCWECEATIQAGMAEADAMISDLRAERDAMRERCEKLDVALHIAAQDLAFVASHSAGIQLATMARKASNDAYAARSAARHATEAK